MDHRDHVELLRGGVPEGAGVWADLGAGAGAFTLALAELLGPDSTIHVLDRDGRALRENTRAMAKHFPGTRVQHHEADFTDPLALPELDGIVMANALHFERDQEAAVRHLRGYLRTGGRMLVVEYNIDRGNRAVPHPVPYRRWEQLAAGAGFEHTELIARRPSRTFGEIYSAVSW